MVPSYSAKYGLRIGDFDRYNRLQPFTVLDLFQEVATVQADNMGIGRDAMMERGVFWVVTRLKYEVLRHPQLHDTVEVATWPHSPTRFSFLRDYSMKDEDGQYLIRATSEWVLVDAANRSFASVLDFYDGPTEFCPERAFDSKPRKIKDFAEDEAQGLQIIPRFTDIDINGHVNNARYANFVIDAINPTGNGHVKTFQIDFRHEVMPGEQITVHAKRSDGEILAKGIDLEGVIKFAAHITLE